MLRHSSSLSAVTLFDNERDRQLSLVKRVKNILVKATDTDNAEKTVKLNMNKHLSTPFSCTKRELGANIHYRILSPIRRPCYHEVTWLKKMC